VDNTSQAFEKEEEIALSPFSLAAPFYGLIA